MRRLWLTFSLGSTDWRVYAVPPDDAALRVDGQECYAVTLTETCEILVADNVHPTRRAELLLHEILHACIASSGLGVTQRWTDAREEVVVRGLAGPLAHALVSGGLWRGRRVPR